MKESPAEDKPTVRELTYPRLPHLGLSLYCDGPKNREFLSYSRTAELLKYAMRMLPDTKVGISAIAGKKEDYKELRELCPAASFGELNLKYSFRLSEEESFFGTAETSSVAAPIGAAKKLYDEMLTALNAFLEAFRGLPIFVKISRELNWLPGTYEFKEFLRLLASHKAGLIIANSLKTDVPPFMAEGREWRWSGGVLCGERLFEDTIQLIQRCDQECKDRNIPIIATGGMVGPTQVLAALQAGATAVQLCTLFDYKGRDYYRALCWNLEGRIENLGLRKLSEYVQRLQQESASTIYNMPFIYFERFFSKEAQRRLLRDVLRSQRMDALLMSGRNLVDEWSDSLDKRFQKNLGVRLLLPNPDGSVLAAIQKSWGISEGAELDARKQRIRESRNILLQRWEQSSPERKETIEREKKEAANKRLEAAAASGAATSEDHQGDGDEDAPEEKEAIFKIFYSDQCPFYSFYIFDDRVYIAPYPFTRPGKLDAPVYVFLAGTYEYERIDSEFQQLLAFAKQTEEGLQLKDAQSTPEVTQSALSIPASEAKD
jgi:hypothetical protein